MAECPGAEPVAGLHGCVGTQEEIAAAVKMGNVKRLVEHTAAASAHGADIIVFSEGALGIAGFSYTDRAGNTTRVQDGGGVASGGLAETIPDPAVAGAAALVPCTDPRAAKATPALHAMSCAAKKHNITIVLDMGDKQPCSAYPYSPNVTCSECPAEGYFRFNSQVAIGNNGRLLQKYHKMHPYNPSPHAHCIGDGHQQPGLHDPRWFDTAFGVRFAMQICYDVSFFTPAAQLAMDPALQISDVVFSTHWENEEGPPISAGSAYFQAYSRGHGVNLLAANAGMGMMHTGSGIFSEGALLANAWQPGNPHYEVLLVATVPKLGGKPAPNRVDSVVAPWGVSPLTTNPPAWQTTTLTAGQAANFTVGVPNTTFACRFSLTIKPQPAPATTTTSATAPHALSAAGSLRGVASGGGGASAAPPGTPAPAAAAAATEAYAMVAVSGAWFGGGLPARSCAIYRIPPSDVPSGPAGLAAWKPWGEGGATLYRFPNATLGGKVDMAGTLIFSALTVEGDFFKGDIVLPMLAAAGGAPAGADIEIIAAGRGFKLTKPHPILQAQAYLNTHEPKVLFPPPTPPTPPTPPPPAALAG